jgi:hypothetical protein
VHHGCCLLASEVSYTARSFISQMVFLYIYIYIYPAPNSQPAYFIGRCACRKLSNSVLRPCPDSARQPTYGREVDVCGRYYSTLIVISSKCSLSSLQTTKPETNVLCRFFRQFHFPRCRSELIAEISKRTFSFSVRPVSYIFRTKTLSERARCLCCRVFDLCLEVS